MTELLYLQDSYLRKFKARITASDKDEKWVTLDRTAFYPKGGGQPGDTGFLSLENTQIRVEKVRKDRGKILHYLSDFLPEISSVITGIIDWDNRYRYMRIHTALHMLSAVIWRNYQAQVTGGNIDLQKGRLDFELDTWNADLIRDIEIKLNLEVIAARKISSRIISRKEANKIPDLIRTKINLLPPHLKQIRIVEIEGLDLQADSGTHVRNTSEVGKIVIAKYKSKGRLNKRIHIELEG